MNRRVARPIERGGSKHRAASAAQQSWDPVRLFSLRREQALRCLAGICRRSPLERRQSQRAGAWMGSDKDGRFFSAGRSASRMRNPDVACHERGRVGAIERRVFLSSTPSCAEPDRGRPRDSGRAAGRVRPHLRHTSRLTEGCNKEKNCRYDHANGSGRISDVQYCFVRGSVSSRISSPSRRARADTGRKRHAEAGLGSRSTDAISKVNSEGYS